VKKLLAAFLGVLGFAWWRKRREAPAVPSPDPAEELRAKLAEQRDAEPEAGPEPEAPQDVAERRSDVHDRARRAMEDLATPEE
jgi:broad specificity phosphatase PhoE